MYKDLVRLPARYLFTVTSWLILLLAAGMAAQGARWLEQAGLAPALGNAVWNTEVPIYVPKENFGVFGAALPGTFYKRDDSMPPEMRYFDGKPPETLRFGTPWPEGNFTWVRESTEIAPGFHLILLKGPWGVDLDVMEISLAIDTPKGVVLVVGCSHPTIEKVVEAASAATGKPIHLVFGGTHLLLAQPDGILNNHRLKPVGLSCGLKVRIRVDLTTRLLGLHPKIIIGIRLKVMLQVALYHFLRHLPHRRAEIPPRPEVPSPVALLDVRKLLAQMSRRTTLDAPHDLARRKVRGGTDQDVRMILARHPAHDPNLKSITGLPHQFSHPLCHVTSQNVVPVLRHPHKVVLDLVHRVAAISVVHVASTVVCFSGGSSSQLKLTGQSRWF
jgi:hypothetical protein